MESNFGWRCAIVISAALVLAAGAAEARVETLQWKHNDASKVDGFHFHVGTATREYDLGSYVDVGKPAAKDGIYTYDLEVPDGMTVYVAMDAYNAQGDSRVSNELKLVPPPLGQGGGEPVVEEPKTEEPVVEEPKAEEPVVEEPKAEEPKAEEPKAESPDDGSAGSPPAAERDDLLEVEREQSFEELPVRAWRVLGAADLDGEAGAEIMWRHRNHRQHQRWVMDGSTIVEGGPFEVARDSMRVAGFGDLDDDGSEDVFWWDKRDKRVEVWVNGSTDTDAVTLAQGDPDTKLRPFGVGDFDGDGHADMMWRERKQRGYRLWLLAADGSSTEAELEPTEERWKATALGDFNGDGKTDVLWRHRKEFHVWLMDGAQRIGEVSLGRPERGWKFRGVGDFDADGNDDVLWYERGERACHVWLMNGEGVEETALLGVVEKRWKVVDVGDFDDDGFDDLLLEHRRAARARIWFVGANP